MVTLRRLLPLAIAALALCLAAPASAEQVRGIDVSRFQGDIDWPRVGQTKNAFAFVQASRGSGSDCLVAPEHCGPDPYWQVNYLGAKEAGLRAGPYHRAFASGSNRRQARRDARREARVFNRTVGELERGDLRPVLDVETPFVDLNPARLRLWIKIWTRRVQRRLGVRPMIYTNASSWAATGDTRRFARRGFRLWVANYGVSSPLVPAENWAGRGWAVWQFTSSGRVRGIQGNVDKNRLGVPIAKITARPRPRR
jgi:lysozyme